MSAAVPKMRRAATKSTKTLPIWNADDFLTARKQVVRPLGRGRKRTAQRQTRSSTTKTKRPKTTDDNGSEAHRSVCVTLKSPASVLHRDMQHQKKMSKTVAESLSMSVGAKDKLILLDDDLLRSHILQDSEQNALDKALREFRRENQEKAVIAKLQFKMPGATNILGVKARRKGIKLAISSELNEEYRTKLSSESGFFWLAAESSLAKLALHNLRGDTESGLLCALPNYSGVVRVKIDGTAAGAQKLLVSATNQ